MSEHVDVLIVGAGLSGIGAASHLQRECPGKSFAILESRGAVGGTWDLFRYPGIRSDSDMYTMAYSFRPWTNAKAIADGESIRTYITGTIASEGLQPHLRLNHRVVCAEWSSASALWTVTAIRTSAAEYPGERAAQDPGVAAAPAATNAATDPAETITFTCSFLSVCSGYYRYDQGFTPAVTGADSFAGRLVHPQHWPADLDVTGRRVVVVGSGATAVTLVPALAKTAAHVTMLQRSPTYIAPVPSRDRLAERLRGRLPERLAYNLVRLKNIGYSMFTYQLSRRRPETMKAILRRSAVAKLPAGFDVDTHLAPDYNPWDQRLCAIPDGDLYRAISRGAADIVTGRIERITPTGIGLASGATLDADVIVLATGLNLLVMGGIALTVDGAPVDVSRTLAYKGMMLSGVPNLALTIGYANASWTLKADLVARYVCRLLKYLDRHHYQSVTPQVPASVASGELVPLINLKASYILRSIGDLPQQGAKAPWRLHQNYVRDFALLRLGPVTDDVRFGRRGEPVSGWSLAEGPTKAAGDGTTAAGGTMAAAPADGTATTAPAIPELHGTGVIAVDGIRLRYRVTGQGAPVLLLHGIGHSLEDWNEQHDRLSAQHTVYSLDLPGFAYSQRLPGTTTLPRLAAILPAFLDAVGVSGPIPVIGNSLGGAVAMTLAVTCPDRVSSLVLANSAGFGREVTLALRLLAIRPLTAVLMRPRLKTSARAVQAIFYDKSAATDSRIRHAYTLSQRPDHATTLREVAGDLGTFRGVRPEWRISLITALRQLDIPILVAWGDHDRILPFGQLEAAVAALPNAETHVFVKTGHMPQIERPDEFAALVEDFLSRKDTGESVSRSNSGAL